MLNILKLKRVEFFKVRLSTFFTRSYSTWSENCAFTCFIAYRHSTACWRSSEVISPHGLLFRA